MCLRALDYIAPVEVTFGDFLRAVVTADADVSPNDDANYRLAFVDAFRRYGILPTESEPCPTRQCCGRRRKPAGMPARSPRSSVTCRAR